MDRASAEKVLDSLMEKLAFIEHERWAHWQRYVHDKGERQADGSLVIPEELVARWEQLIATPYCKLTEEEKQSDRDQVRRYVQAIVDGFVNEDS